MDRHILLVSTNKIVTIAINVFVTIITIMIIIISIITISNTQAPNRSRYQRPRLQRAAARPVLVQLAQQQVHHHLDRHHRHHNDRRWFGRLNPSLVAGSTIPVNLPSSGIGIDF